MKSRQIGNTLINAVIGALCGRPPRAYVLQVVHCSDLLEEVGS